jgi:hypothetical protein
MSSAIRGLTMANETLELLKPICSSDTDRPKIATPFAMQWANRRWAAATNGHMLVALPYEGELRTDGPKAAAIVPAAPATHKASVAALRGWAGEPVMEACPECHGDSYWNCDCPNCGDDHACEHCEGKGEARKRRYGILLGAGLNPDYLRAILATTTAEEVTILHAKPRDPFRFEAPDWLALLMPIMPESEELKGAPVFREASIASAAEPPHE